MKPTDRSLQKTRVLQSVHDLFVCLLFAHADELLRYTELTESLINYYIKQGDLKGRHFAVRGDEKTYAELLESLLNRIEENCQEYVSQSLRDRFNLLSRTTISMTDELGKAQARISGQQMLINTLTACIVEGLEWLPSNYEKWKYLAKTAIDTLEKSKSC